METEKPLYADVARVIVEKFGGAKKLGSMLGIAASTIGVWVKSGDIPEKYRADLIRLAKKHGVPHTPFDYVAYLAPLAA
jgi:hypothetical protein